MRGVSWRAKASELYTLLLRILNWAVSLSLFNSDLVWQRQRLRGSKRGEPVKVVSEEKRAFLETFRGLYGFPDTACPIDKLRTSEFPRLNGVVYVDHAGATLHADSQLKAALYGNPRILFCTTVV